MIKLYPVEDKGLYYLQNISNSKTKKYYKKNKDEITAKEFYNLYKTFIIKTYNDYLDNKLSLEKINVFDYIEIINDFFLDCYNNTTNGLDEMKYDIVSAQKPSLGNMCQACGINNADTFDHFLPKSIMSVFSVLPENLIPMCSECNRKKSNEWPINRILNLYYDKLPKIKIINCRINIVDQVPVPRFFFEKCWKSKLSSLFRKNEIDIIENHYRKLNLFYRFEVACNRKIYEYIYLFKQFSSDMKSYINIIMQKRLTLIKQYGINYWECILLEELISNRNFHKFLSDN
jgi:hypothetical protein